MPTGSPHLDLGIVRDTAETYHLASTEPEGVTYAEVDADGVPALWVIPAGADLDRALPHFHFGGSVTASMHADRKAAGHIAKAAGIRSLVVDFRHAPEHPYPARLDDVETAYRWLLAQGYQPQHIGSTGHSVRRAVDRGPTGPVAAARGLGDRAVGAGVGQIQECWTRKIGTPEGLPQRR
ncbi:hypothetical protein OK074_2064 [Actinobacteria bacterium OK074]|nr:hypothetical protein OK074_2064 [Actinobacteria bacterium OK074]